MGRKSLWKSLFSKNKSVDDRSTEPSSTASNSESQIIEEQTGSNEEHQSRVESNNDDKTAEKERSISVNYPVEGKKKIQKVLEVPAETFILRKIEKSEATLNTQIVTVNTITVLEPEIISLEKTEINEEEKKRRAAEELKKKLKLGLFGGDSAAIALLYDSATGRNKCSMTPDVNVNDAKITEQHKDICCAAKEQCMMSTSSRIDNMMSPRDKTRQD
ncbi:uncharacterized protein LOC111620196 [Centruroides sculpturatus]|uniref:uncharacterized protein LOC111620196 n=1 Tax=Centruroides sculpturatus TaxID=218467 RepID=UPI000C6E75E3|nr:uncharacterized protein LOC111620196 [Centruroides sculpturatus]